MRKIIGALTGWFIPTFVAPFVLADVQLPAIFGDHMVLQEGITIPVWGTAQPGEAVSVAVDTKTAATKADAQGKWGEGDFPFLFVQLAAYKGGDVQNWPYLREAQLMTLALPNTGMASAVDIGDPQNIPPKDKEDVGHRLALAALHVAYGKDLVYSGPIYDSMKIGGSSVSISFKQTGSGLAIGQAPWTAADSQPLPTDKLIGFTIYGSDQKWTPADARIEGNQVIVSSSEVPAPAAVRYNWANAPEGNLYNKFASLPFSYGRLARASNREKIDPLIYHEGKINIL